MRRIAVVFVVAGAGMAGCPSATPSSSPTTLPPAGNADKPPRPAVPPFPTIDVTIKQRSRAAVPNSSLVIGIGDITRGQVDVWVVAPKASEDPSSQADGAPGEEIILAGTSMEEADSRRLAHGGRTYQLKLKNLHNSLSGEDFAVFAVSDASGTGLGEQDKIDRLLADIESLKGATFVRNGEGHSPVDAAAHLRRKLRAADGKVKTAEAFITQLASESSVTGVAYTIRLADGTSVPVGEYLRERLGEIERGDK
jgi:hypothetical protein